MVPAVPVARSAPLCLSVWLSEPLLSPKLILIGVLPFATKVSSSL